MALVAIALGVLLVGCGDNGADTEATRDTVEETGREAREQAEDAFASWRTSGERILDEIQTRNAPELKQQLLDQCRDVLERLRQADSQNADQVEELCDRVRDTDPSNASVWRDLREEISRLPAA